MYTGPNVKYPPFLSHFNDELSGHIFERYSNIKFHENPSFFMRTGGHAEANSRFSQLGESA